MLLQNVSNDFLLNHHIFNLAVMCRLMHWSSVGKCVGPSVGVVLPLSVMGQSCVSDMLVEALTECWCDWTCYNSH